MLGLPFAPAQAKFICFVCEAVPEGLNDSSLAIYCQEGAPGKIRPVGNGMMMSTIYSSPNINQRRCRIESHRTLRGGPDFGLIPGNKLPGYDHAVPPGRSITFHFRPYLRTSAVDLFSVSRPFAVIPRTGPSAIPFPDQLHTH